jgi:hypothetical protein
MGLGAVIDSGRVAQLQHCFATNSWDIGDLVNEPNTTACFKTLRLLRRDDPALDFDVALKLWLLATTSAADLRATTKLNRASTSLPHSIHVLAAPQGNRVSRVAHIVLSKRRVPILGLGMVKRVRAGIDPVLGKAVAIATPSKPFTPSSAHKTTREVDLLMQKYRDHPHVVQVLAFYARDNGYFYLAMPRYFSDLSRVRALPPSTNVHQIALECAKGLGAVHQTGDAHNDIKPTNFMIADNGAVRLGDFGFSGAPPLLDYCGTYHFVSPEMARSMLCHAPAPTHNHPSDIWALGCTFYFLLHSSHQSPSWFKVQSRSSLLGVIAALRSDAIQRELLAQGFSPEHRQLLTALLHPDPAARPNITFVLSWLQALVELAATPDAPDARARVERHATMMQEHIESRGARPGTAAATALAAAVAIAFDSVVLKSSSLYTETT